MNTAVARHDADADEDKKLDKVLSHLDSVMTRMDEEKKEREKIAGRLDAVCGRMDAADEEKKKEKEDKARKDAEEEEKKTAKARQDSEDATRLAAEAQVKQDAETARVAAEVKARKDAETAAAGGDLATMSASIKALQAQLAARNTVNNEDRKPYVRSWGMAERVAQAFGDSEGASRWMDGESVAAYQRRLLTPYQEHSPQWKGKDLASMSPEVLTVAEEQIYNDAYTAASSPATVPVGTLRASVRTDDTGRKITSFQGDPEACWAPFKQQSRIVTGWTTKFPTQH